MSDYISTTNMGLTVPIVGNALGPNWASELNASLVTLDGHDHSQGKGVAITPAGLNINADLALNSNNLTLIRTLRLQAPSIQPAGASDLTCLYAFGVDLYFRDGSGNQVRLTQSGGVVGAPGNITNLTSPASVTFVGGTSTYVFQSAASTSAILDGASVILRNLVASSKGLTLAPPSAMVADYTITLPSLPASGVNIASINSSGAMGTIAVDNSTMTAAGNILAVKSGGVTPTQIVAGFGLVPTGVILGFGGAAAPTGYLLCDGASYLRGDYPDLFSAIGTAYGTADATHFNVPDSRGLFMRFVSGASTNDPDKTTRTAMATGGNTGNNVGSVQADQVGPVTISMSGGAVGAGTSGNPQHVVQSDNSGLTMNATPTGTTETRSRNFYATAIIKT